MVQIIKEICKSYAIIAFDDIYVKYYRTDMNMLNLGYSISIHKSQGLEYNSVKVVFKAPPAAENG